MALLTYFVMRNRGLLTGKSCSRAVSTNCENMEISGVRESDRAILELQLWSTRSLLARKPSRLLLSCLLTRNVSQHSQLQALSHRWCHPRITERPRSVTITLLQRLLQLSWCCCFTQYRGYLPHGAMELTLTWHIPPSPAWIDENKIYLGHFHTS